MPLTGQNAGTSGNDLPDVRIVHALYDVRLE
jgi:hypothetical protein